MLILTRKRSEMIRIGDDIVIKVLQTGRGSVKLGIEAPAHVRVMRVELEEKDAKEQMTTTTVTLAELLRRRHELPAFESHDVPRETVSHLTAASHD